MATQDLRSEAVSSIARTARLADRVFRSWLGFKETGRAEPASTDEFYERVFSSGEGAALHHSVGGREKRVITREDLPRFLTTPEMRDVIRTESEMEELVRDWEEIVRKPDRVTGSHARRLADIAEGLAAHMRRITELLDRLGFELDDHYERMRQIAHS